MQAKLKACLSLQVLLVYAQKSLIVGYAASKCDAVPFLLYKSPSPRDS